MRLSLWRMGGGDVADMGVGIVGTIGGGVVLAVGDVVGHDQGNARIELRGRIETVGVGQEVPEIAVAPDLQRDALQRVAALPGGLLRTSISWREFEVTPLVIVGWVSMLDQKTARQQHRTNSCYLPNSEPN